VPARADPPPGRLLVMGAGLVGAFVGGRLQSAGVPVDFVGRAHRLFALRRGGLKLSDLNGRHDDLPADALALHERIPPGLQPALVLLCVKSGATADAARELAAALPAGTPVLSLQNGIGNAALAQAQAPALRLLPGMVGFNVADLGDGRLHRGTDGGLAAQDDAVLRRWQPAFAKAGLPLSLHPELRAVQRGKLLLNLNNPVNALSGLPLRAQLLDRDWRRCSAALVAEALDMLAAAGIAPARVGGAPPRLMPAVLRLPTPLFRAAAARLLRIDAQARSSMADDLGRGRPTEIDALCGEVVRLAAALGREAPANARMLALVRAAEAGAAAPTAAQALRALSESRSRHAAPPRARGLSP
jgi:2-dehydropantoate 2-reductase